MDVLSDVLNAARLRGAVYFDVTASAPWVSVNPSMDDIGATMMPGGEHVIPFHVLTEGQAWAWPADRSLPATKLEKGDVFMFPSGESHVVASDPAVERVPEVDTQFYRDAARSHDPFTLVEIGVGGEKTKFVCGYLSCDTRPFNPLLASLPPMLVAKPPPNGADLIQSLIRLAIEETRNAKAGSETVLARISELMFVQALREYIESLGDSPAGWLAGLRNEKIGHALRLIHARPSGRWSLGHLASDCGMSRSKLAADFRKYTGEAPMHYLARWRIQVAAGLLEAGTASIAQIAEQVGYESEAAFKRAFKKYAGATAGQWRRAKRPKAAPI